MSQEISKHQQHRMTQVGVWLDHHRAVIVAAPNGEFAVAESLDTTAPNHHRSSEFAINNAEGQLEAKHFHAVAAHLASYHHILLFGPGTAQEELRNLLGADAHFHDKKIVVEPASHMTENQIVAKVRDYFDHA